MSRGRFSLDEAGQPVMGHGVVLDITGHNLSTRAFTARDQSADGDALSAATDLGISLHGLVAGLSSPKLQWLAQQLLLEIGRLLARSDMAERRRHMN